MLAFPPVLRRTAIVAFAAMLSLAGAQAQEPSSEEPTATTEEAGAAPTEGGEEAAAVRPSGAAFMQPLGRLANILGSVHFLRTLCGDENASIWRERMNDLIAAQNPSEADRRILVAQFNGGYRAFESTYRQCTPSADVATRRYLEEGAALSREISTRYGN